MSPVILVNNHGDARGLCRNLKRSVDDLPVEPLPVIGRDNVKAVAEIIQRGLIDRFRHADIFPVYAEINDASRRPFEKIADCD